MDNTLQRETEKLTQSWMRQDAAMLRDYLVQDVEDPRCNVQSVLTRHFLVVALFGERFQTLADRELEFAAAMNWLLKLAKQAGTAEEFQAVLHALRRDADNAEGIEVPGFVRRIFAALPAEACGQSIPHYLEETLLSPDRRADRGRLPECVLNRFQELWRDALAAAVSPGLSVLEPACGSANDYRYLEAYGLAKLIDYTGFDLCEKNVANARALFPRACFRAGNVFDIAAADQSFDCCFVHDLFEHLSLEGLDAALNELCRVTRRGLCLHFFNMDEVDEHRVQPVQEYHWNLLSMERLRDRLMRRGYAVQVLNIGSLLRWRTGCEETHNPNAYTFIALKHANP